MSYVLYRLPSECMDEEIRNGTSFYTLSNNGIKASYDPIKENELTPR